MTPEVIPREPSALELWGSRGLRAIWSWNRAHEAQVQERDALLAEQRDLAWRAHRLVHECLDLGEWDKVRDRSRDVVTRLEELKVELDPAFDEYWRSWNVSNPKPKVRGA